MALSKVKSGDPLVIPAETFNAFIDAAQDLRNRQSQIRREGRRDIRSSGIVLIKNSSGEDRDRFHILGLDEPLVLPEDNESEFANRVALIGKTPSFVEHRGKYAVLLEALKTDTLGQGMVSGICTARLSVQDEDHSFAEVKDGECAYLLSRPTGSAQILWKESGTGTKWGWIRFPVSGEGTIHDPWDLTHSGETPEAECWGNWGESWTDSDNDTVVWHRDQSHPSGIQDHHIGVKVTLSLGNAYYHDGDKKWYETKVDFYWDSVGKLVKIGKARRVEVDVPEVCS